MKEDYKKNQNQQTTKEKRKGRGEQPPAHRWAGLFASSLDESGVTPLARPRTFQTLMPYAYCRLDAVFQQNESQRLPLVQIGRILSFL